MKSSSLLASFLSGLACAGFLAATSNASATTVALYTFNGNANDSSGNGHHGTVDRATLTTDRFGNPNSAYMFIPDQNITTVGWGAGLPSTMTISVWGQSDWFDQVNAMLFNAGASGLGPNLFFSKPDDGIFWNTWDGTANPFTGGGGFPASINDLGWHHYAVVNDQSANTAKLYIDGGLYGTAAYRAAGATFAIGGAPIPFNWVGKIDDITIYDTAFTAGEVAALYQESSATPDAGSTLGLLGVAAAGLALVRRKLTAA